MAEGPATTELFVPYLLHHHQSALLDILRSPEPDRHYGVPVSLARLAAANHALADALCASPRAVLPFLDAALLKAQEAMLARAWPDRHMLTLKENVHGRLSGLGLFLDASRAAAPRIADIGAAHIDRVITLRGTVVRTGAVKLLEARRLYECGRCRHRFVVAADLELGATVTLPPSCPAPRAPPCKGTTFRHCEEVALYTNFQEAQVQEGSQCLALGAAPRALTVLLQDELADCCQVGGAPCGVTLSCHWRRPHIPRPVPRPALLQQAAEAETRH
jgi:DNA helicase MCM9